MEEEMKEMNQFYEWYDGWALRDMHWFMINDSMKIDEILRAAKISGRKIVWKSPESFKITAKKV